MNGKNRRLISAITYAPRILTAIIGLSVIVALVSSTPSTHITIEAGTKGGLFDVMSHELAQNLKPHGITVKVVNRPDSLRIVDDIEDPKSPVEAGFIASDTSAQDFTEIKQIGTVMLAPVYLLSRKDSGITEITQFKDKSISLYPTDSAAWAACRYILNSYGITPSITTTQYGNGPTIVKNVVDGISETGCFIDVPSGANLDYANKIIAALAHNDLHFIKIPQAEALQARKDFLRPLTIPTGAFNVHPPVPLEDTDTTGASITFVGKNDLPKELVKMISYVLAQQYRGSTSANQAGELPTTRNVNLTAFKDSSDIFANGLPWLYDKFSFTTAAFLDKFLGRYGLVLTALFIFLSTLDLFGMPLPYDLVVGSRPRRMQLIIDGIDHRMKHSGKISRRDRRKLQTIEKWMQKESRGLDEIETRLNSMQEHLN